VIVNEFVCRSKQEETSSSGMTNATQSVSNVDLLDGLVTGPVPSLQPLGIISAQPGTAGMYPMFVVAQPGFISMPGPPGVMPTGSGMMSCGAEMTQVGGVSSNGFQQSQQQVIMGMQNMGNTGISQLSGATFSGPCPVSSGLTPNPLLVSALNTSLHSTNAIAFTCDTLFNN